MPTDLINKVHSYVSWDKHLQDMCMPLCLSVPNIKKWPQVNMEMKSKLTKFHSLIGHWEWPSFSSCPEAGAQLTFKTKDLDCCFLSLFIALQELHLTDTTLRLALTWFHVRALHFFFPLPFCVTLLSGPYRLGWCHCVSVLYEVSYYLNIYAFSLFRSH